MNNLTVTENKALDKFRHKVETLKNDVENSNNKITSNKQQLTILKDYNEKNVLREENKKLQSKIKKIEKETIYKMGVLKSEIAFVDQSITSAEKNLNKSIKYFEKIDGKYETSKTEVPEAKELINKYKSDKVTFKNDRKLIKDFVFKQNKISKLESHLVEKEKQLSVVNEKLKNQVELKKLFEVEQVQAVEAELTHAIENAKKEESIEEVKVLETQLQKHKENSVKTEMKIDKLVNKFQLSISKLNDAIEILKNEIETLRNFISENQTVYDETNVKIKEYEKSKKIVMESIALNWEHKQAIKVKNKSQKKYEESLGLKEEFNTKINTLNEIAKLEEDSILPIESKSKKMFNTVERFLLKDWFFVVIVSLLSAGVVLSTCLYIRTGVGALNEIFVVAMLREGLDSGNYTAAMGFAVGFLIARVLEGPLVGILDVGGSILSGVGIGIPAVFLSSSKLSFMMYNPLLALLIGAVVGLIIGIIIMVIRILKPKEANGLGTDIMIGAGNATGKFFGPLVVFSAAMFNPLAGIGAGIGAGIFMWIKKPIVGGAIIGAMLLGAIPAFL